MIRLILILAVVAALVGAAFGGGYLLAFYEVEPVHDLAVRVERKANESSTLRRPRRRRARCF